MSLVINRRRFVQTLSVAALAATSSSALGAEDEEIQRPVGVPLGPYGAESTADEVTAAIDLSGKTALITGCNSGLGYETMRVLAMRGAHVIGAARTIEKARDACKSVEGSTTPIVCELSDFSSAAACAEAVRAMGMPLDILICNAGIMALPELQQVGGIERHFVVNHLGHFVLTNGLLQQLKSAPQGRVVVVGSMGHRWAPAGGIQFDDLSGESWEYDPNAAYGHSKLANGLFSIELARRLQNTAATSNSIHPGIINTNLGRHMPKYMLVLASLIGWTFMKSVEAGAATSCYVATNPSLANISGYYFEDCNPVVAGYNMDNVEMATLLWTVSEELTRGYLV